MNELKQRCDDDFLHGLTKSHRNISDREPEVAPQKAGGHAEAVRLRSADEAERVLLALLADICSHVTC